MNLYMAKASDIQQHYSEYLDVNIVFSQDLLELYKIRNDSSAWR